nr:iron ABC transporter permease [Acetatifactor sp.]
GMNMIKILDTDVSVNATQFLIGSLAGVTMKAIKYPAVGIVVGVLVATVIAKALNILALGDGVANAVGLPVHLFRFIFVVIASALAGFVVSFAGLVGFVGLIVPHICRYLFGHDARVLIPASALLGAILVLVSDLISRTVFSPFELPVGIILSLTGGPFFLYLLMRKGGRRVNA